MVITTINQMSLLWIFLILISPFSVSSQSKGQQEQLLEAWVTRCFIEGYNLVNSTSMDCNSIKLSPKLLSVEEVRSQCHGFHKFGCNLGLSSLFCNEGISKVLSNYPENIDYPCNDIQIPEDFSNLAFECCTTCKGGITDESLNDRCIIFSGSSIADQARYRCCKAAAARKNASSNVTSVEPTLPISSGNITRDEISKLVHANDMKINSSLDKILNSSELVTPISTNFTVILPDESVTPSLNVSSTMVEESSSLSTTFGPSSTEGEHETSPLATTETIKSTSTESTTTESSSTFSTVTVRAQTCDEGYRQSNYSNECEDINECEQIDVCPSSSNCFNFNGGYVCCPIGAEKDDKNECSYIDYCEKDPCWQSEDDQHYCLNYFTGRYCIDKIPEGYSMLNPEDYNTLQLIDHTNESYPQYLQISQKEITLKREDYSNHGLIYLILPISLNCDWNFNLDEIKAPIEGDGIKEKQFDRKSEPHKYIVRLNGQVKPQSVIISITCNVHHKPIYRNTIYLTFKPPSGYKITRNQDSD